jgi:CMP-N-acetylneuraminic acid synthetase
MKKTIKSLIISRKGSQRVPSKNTKPFAGSSLLEIKIQQAKRLEAKGLLNGVVVNTNDEYVMEIAEKYGCEIIKRDEYYCSNEISANELHAHLGETFTADIAMFTNTTSPLVKDETLERAIKEYWENVENGPYDSLNACHVIKEFLWLDGKAINYDPDNKPRSQDLPEILSLDSATDIIDCKQMIKDRSFVSKNPYLFVVDSIEGKEVDWPEDFEICELLYKKHYME